MKLSQLFSILFERRRTVLAVAFLTVLACVVAILLSSKIYRAETSLLLNYKGADAISGSTAPAQASSSYFGTYVATQLGIVRSPTIALRVVQRLQLTKDPTYRARYAGQPGAPGTRGDSDAFARWIAGRLLDKLQVKPAQDSGLLTIAFSAPDPRMAAAVANGFAREYIALGIALNAQPAAQASRYLEERLAAARKALETALAESVQYQRESGVLGAEGALDIETARLAGLSSQHLTVEAQLIDARSRYSQAERGNAIESPDVAANLLIQGLKSDLSKANMKLSSIVEYVTPEHPSAIAALAEVNAIRSELKRQTGVLTGALKAGSDILARRERELAAAVLAQRSKVLDASAHHARLAVHAREIETRKRSYDALSQRLAETSIQGLAQQSDVTILAEASPPALPSNPRRLLLLAVAALAGVMLGVGAALAQEHVDRRIHCADDIRCLTDHPLVVAFGPLPVRALPAPGTALAWRIAAE